jgi:hypothetical protein
MSEASPGDLAAAVLQLYPRTFSEELGVRSLDTPSGSFRLLVMALLMSARIRASTALDAARALFRRRWTTAPRMAEASWEERARVLNESGYARYDERTSTALGDTAQLLIDRYGGDLRQLRRAAEHDPAAERRLLKQCKGIGDVGVDIFFREAQRTWDELYPFVDRRAREAARRLDLDDDAEGLTRLVRGDDFVRLVNGLVRVELDDVYNDVIALASGRQ